MTLMLATLVFVAKINMFNQPSQFQMHLQIVNVYSLPREQPY